eukprot:3980283-Pyramimonas_sp.AAC.2
MRQLLLILLHFTGPPVPVTVARELRHSGRPLSGADGGHPGHLAAESARLVAEVGHRALHASLEAPRCPRPLRPRGGARGDLRGARADARLPAPRGPQGHRAPPDPRSPKELHK